MLTEGNKMLMTLIEDGKQFTKNRTGLSDEKQAKLEEKVKKTIDSSKELKAMSKLIENQVPHFDEAAKKKGQKLRPYQRIVAAELLAKLKEMHDKGAVVRYVWSLAAG